MAAYRVGSVGPEVLRLQTRLAQLGFYAGPLDSQFGGGTDAAVRAFQTAEGLAADGVVGANTWAALFPEGKVPKPVIASAPLAERCLAITGSFETNEPPPECFAGLSGDFDGMGISFGVCQWNLGSQTLQPLLLDLAAAAGPVVRAIFGDRYPVLQAVLKAPLEEQLQWARAIQTPKLALVEPWHGYFRALGRTPECEEAQRRAADTLFKRALSDCAAFGVVSERAAALLFDIYVQNGGFAQTTRAAIMAALAGLPRTTGWKLGEVERLKVIANLRADASKPQWQADVRHRKLTIAEGSGVVHGRQYDLEADYGIRLAILRTA